MATVKNSTPIRTALKYAVFGFLWILLSDWALELFVEPTSPTHLWIQTAKGWLFVLISASLIYFILKIDLKSLVNSEERYRAIFNSSLDPIMLTSLDGEILAVNPAGCRLFERTEEEIKQIGRNGIINVSDPRLAIALEERDRTGKYEGELTFIRRNGEKFPADVSSSVFKDKDGNRRTSTTIRDITERKRAEDLLHESEQKLQDVFNVMEEGMALNEFIFDEAGEIIDYRILEVNPAFERIAMLTREQAVGKKASEVYQMSSEYIRDFWKKNLGSGQSIRTEYYVPEINKWRHISTSQPFNNKFATVFIDTTEQKMAEIALRESETNLRAIWENSTQSYMLIDPDRRVRKMNRIAIEQELEILGRVTQPGDSIYDIVRPQERGWFDETFEKAMAGEMLQFERSFYKGGNQHWYEYRLSPVRTDNGESLGVFLVTTDITERKQAEEKIREKDIQFRKLSANVPDLIYQFTRKPDGTYYVPVASEGIRNIFGCTPEDVADDFAPIARVIYPEDSERVIHDIEFSAKHLTFFTCEFRVQIPGKEGIQWIYSRSTPEKLPDGSVTWYGFNTNITERKQAEIALRESEENLAEAQRMAHIGSWEWDMLANTVIWSKEMYRVFDVDPETFDGKPEFLLTLIHPDDIEKITNSINDNLEDGSSPTMEYRVVHRDGSIHHVFAEGRVKFNEAGKPIQSIGTVQDITERKQAEEARRASDLRFRAISENSLAGIYIVQNGKLSYVNAALAEIFKYDPEELLGADPLMLIHPDDHALVSENIRRRIAGEVESLRYEFRGLCKNGKIKYIEVLGARVDLEGQPAIIGNIVDITERKQAEALLQESEFKYRALVENMQVGIVAHDSDTKILFFNPMASQLLGLSSDQMQGKAAVDPAWHFIGEDGNQLPLENYPVYQGLRSSSPITNIILGIVLPDGETTTWVQCNVHHISDRTGQTRQIIVTFIDITKRKQAEELVRRYADELEKRVEERTAEVHDLYNNAPAGYHSLNAQGMIVQINQTELDWLGYAREELVGVKSFAELFTPQSKKYFAEKFPIFMKQGWIKDLEFDVVRKDGSILPILVNATAIYDESGNFVMSRSSLFDITQRKQAELELHAANIALEKASKLKDEFLANMSHELRTPLNSIMGFSEILLEGVRGPINENQKQAVQMIRVSGEHLLGLINDILDVSRIEAGKFELHTEIIQVNEICQKSLNFIKQLANKKSITVEYASSPPAAVLSADPIRLKQILVNLLNNAVKFTPEKGTVKLQVQADAQAGLMHFSVIDTGIGIASSDLDKLFQPFVQLDSSLSRQHEGSGLGLSLVKKMAEMHGGSVAVHSEVNTGSRFTLSLPWSPPHEDDLQALLDGEESTSTKSVKSLSCGKILIADDNEVNLMMLQDYLENIGHQVFVAHHGGEVLPKVEEDLPDIILMDLQMPYVNGFEATKRLRADPRFASVPIIALTAFAMPGDRERCLAAGMNEYISKPFKLKEINEMIERFLNQHST